jgi:hypothetical protein
LIDSAHECFDNGIMSTLDDVRKLFQDFLAPELREIRTRLDAQEKINEIRHNELLLRIEGLKTSFELNKRLERLEARQITSQ